MKKQILFFILFSLFSLRAAGDTLAANSSLTVDQFGVCRILTNTNATSFYVPTGLAGDWSTFLNHMPTGITAASCVIYAWVLVSTSGTCTGGSPGWSNVGFGSCTGGTPVYSPVGACSAACDGGIQNYSCTWSANSGVQYQTGTCSYTAGSGTQPATYECRGNGVVKPDVLCPSPKPTTVTCTPVCGSQPVSQACAPIGTPNCGAPATQPCNTQACEPCPGFNACDQTNFCTYYWSDSIGDGTAYCNTSAKYCLNGVPVFDGDGFDGCFAYSGGIGLRCSDYPPLW